MVTSAAIVLIALLNAGCAHSNDRAAGAHVNLAAKVRNALVRDPAMSHAALNIDTYEGQVQLAGFVDTLEQKVQAERIARSTPGVTAVTNTIVIKAR